MLFIAALLIFLISVGSVAMRRNKADLPQQTKGIPTIAFAKTLIDLGDKNMDAAVEARYTIYNKGTTDLLITDVLPDCHCTVASYQKTSISPNDSSQIILKYNPAVPGIFQSSAIVSTNVSSSPTILILRGNIISSRQQAP